MRPDSNSPTPNENMRVTVLLVIEVNGWITRVIPKEHPKRSIVSTNNINKHNIERSPSLSILVGFNLFYICIIVYLYGDLAIYAAAVPKSLRDVTWSVYIIYIYIFGPNMTLSPIMTLSPNMTFSLFGRLLIVRLTIWPNTNTNSVENRSTDNWQLTKRGIA